MTEIAHRDVQVNGLRMRIAEAGSGPTVLLLHGFPESWYSWRHQLVALAEAGFHAVAPDQRGYGGTDRPERVEEYSIMHLTGDALALLDALGVDRAVIAGHDWGAPVAWHAAQFRPDRVRAVIGLSGIHRPRSSRPPLEIMRRTLGEDYYMVRFQRPGEADAELARDLPATFRRLLTGSSGDAAGDAPVAFESDGFLAGFPEPGKLPGWLTEEDIAAYAAQYAAGGFTGPLNWYRNLDRNWELTAAWHRAPVTPPALYIAGERDFAAIAPDRVAGLRGLIPNLREPVWLPGCGHWTQQERPAEVSDAMIGFLRSL
ncbi:alpha/beta hydrolase [Actinomadura craniellae]|uniref:Alpha/beta hydrolase n=1 Tax=Actinomadura craniellae TaxID=2231787 RepID=A0A365GVZ3_9ACTN|nr:alpha/beta hydrolase [Actinomadura craniellae]RAY10954.1 alpha/beta hydrolase [Actinomadura craniellae]